MQIYSEDNDMKNHQYSSLQMYEKIIEQFPDWKKWLQTELDYINNFINKNHNVLVIGVGWGREIIQLAKYCNSITGIEIDEKELKIADELTKNSNNVELLLMDMFDLNLNKKFDFVLALGNIIGNIGEHKKQFIKKVTTVLKPGGRFFMGVYRIEASAKRKEIYSHINCKVDDLGSGVLILDDTYFTEGFSIVEIIELFAYSNFNIQISSFDYYGYLIEARQFLKKFHN